jgi:glyoxylase-like metal-dependent hydrolase (beta-lactamase superfamily II)
MEIITLTHKHTKSYLIGDKDRWVMLDAGWPDSFVHFSKLIKENRVRIKDIQYLIVTHFHMDHAGLTQVFKDCGVVLLLHTCQNEAVTKMNDFFIKKPHRKYKPILEAGNRVVLSSESRTILKEVGIDGEIVPTPGHSPDSVSLIIDNKCAFTGDLPDLDLVPIFNDVEMTESWQKILAFGVQTIYPAHAMTYDVKRND